MKIAIPTNDRAKIAERSGRAKEFAIYQIEENEIASLVFIENEHEKTHHSGDDTLAHHHEGVHGHDDLVKLLSGVSIIVGKKFGPHFSRDFHKAGVQMKLTKLDLLEDIVNELIQKSE